MTLLGNITNCKKWLLQKIHYFTVLTRQIRQVGSREWVLNKSVAVNRFIERWTWILNRSGRHEQILGAMNRKGGWDMDANTQHCFSFRSISSSLHNLSLIVLMRFKFWCGMCCWRSFELSCYCNFFSKKFQNIENSEIWKKIPNHSDFGTSIWIPKNSESDAHIRFRKKSEIFRKTQFRSDPDPIRPISTLNSDKYFIEYKDFVKLTLHGVFGN